MAFLGNFLRMMVILSALLLVSGGLIFLTSKGIEKPDYQTFDSEVSRIGKGMPLMKTGIALLALTPLFSMILTCVVSLWRHDILYAFISMLVILILLFSLA